ncbi:DMT family transporter [Candidatus Gracilibacteria bacterium]|nr:DMT family transporter [Candidatus Gracilibacteria bacterium]
MEKTKPTKRCILTNSLLPVSALLLFAFAYYLNFNTIPQIKDLGNQQFLEIFNTYGVYLGILLGFLSLILGYIFFGLKKLFHLSKFSVVNPIILALIYAPWYGLGSALSGEPRYTDLARVVLDVLVEPIINASLFMMFLAGIWLMIIILLMIVQKFRPNKFTANFGILLLAVSFFSTGCLSNIEDIACMILPDSDHCYQGSAMQSGNADDCERIKGTKFKDTGSNPPKDKCFLNIAENTGDLNVCKRIKGGLMSYTQEECFLNVAIKFEDPAGCKMLSGASKSDCRAQLGDKIDSYDVIAVDNQIDEIKKYLKDGSDPELEKQLKGLEEKRTNMIDVLTTTKKAEYERQSDPINKDIIGDYAIGELDSESKEKLITLNERLKAQGVKMTQEQLNAFKDYYKFISDPDNDIEQMDDSKLVKDRWNEKLGNVMDKFKIWKSGPSDSEAKLDEQLRFYERMLERQASINEGLSEFGEDVKRNMDMVNNAIEDKVKDAVKDKIIETIFGEITGTTVGATTTVIGEAIDVVKGEAKSKEFRGLVRAYNLGMQEELGKFGGDVEKAHAQVVKTLQTNAYEYEDTNTFAKYGNILENKDCDGTNPHCVNKDVFWKAMKKSFKYQNNK